VIEADRADDALTYIKAGEQVDLVFSDIQTPGSLDGLQLAETLRGKYPDIPVILTSGNADPKHVGILGTFIPKPYDATQIIALISEISVKQPLISRPPAVSALSAPFESPRTGLFFSCSWWRPCIKE
jgi:CheY-like chemotaxis protein